MAPVQWVVVAPGCSKVEIARFLGWRIRADVLPQKFDSIRLRIDYGSWNVPIFFFGLSLPEHGYHAPNENFDWGQASGGIRTFVDYFSRVAAL